ncbi:hypothetical protein GCM10009093_24810 [Brevundimonas terrae]|uniref:DUF2971 domain-containing protein n=1 Tax=Brevundimonas terrae TaxID=363631 RepID=A0ABN0YIZ6_9CAUL|nr:DUF2971 domain-containing protein [Brevundimonas terrae]NIJ27012.1 hypothetical protein [Brevundimonas terrae]
MPILSNLNTNIDVYRILPASRLFDAFLTNKNTLINVEKWEDKYENLMLKSKYILQNRDGSADMVEFANKTILAQCWSKLQESDAMWRIYSPDFMGIKVKADLKSVYDAFIKSLASIDARSVDLDAFLIEVDYLNYNELEQFCQNIDMFDTSNRGVADSVRIKRDSFKHEEEYRIVYNPNIIDKHKNLETYSYDMDFKSIVKEVCFDPRIGDHLFEALKDYLVKIGYNGPVVKSRLYETPEMIFRMR